jgi:hypothetical protein
VTLLIALWMWSMPQAPPPAAAPFPKPDLTEQISCGPIGLLVPPLTGMRVLGGYVHGRMMFGPGDALIVNAGTSQGVRPGQQYFVRRRVQDNFAGYSKAEPPLYGVHTAGWITIVDAKDTMAVATVTHACDSVLEGDYLEPYVDPVMPSPALGGSPDFGHPGRILMADERRQTGYAGLSMVVNRGTEDGVRAGQTLTIYRETLNGQGPIIDVGRATVLSVGPQLSLVRIDSSREAVYVGDLVAIHRITQ